MSCKGFEHFSTEELRQTFKPRETPVINTPGEAYQVFTDDAHSAVSSAARARMLEKQTKRYRERNGGKR